MNAAPVFDRVYAALKQQLRLGTMPPAARLDPAVLSESLAASITPVRDALHRLAGERLVDATNDGFQVPVLSEPDLRDLYAWNHHLMTLALRQTTRAQAGFVAPPPADAHPADIAEGLFAAIARAADNREHALAVAALNDRLHSVRRGERVVLPEIDEELAELLGADLRALRTLLGRYHRRRIAAVPEIVRALYRAH